MRGVGDLNGRGEMQHVSILLVDTKEDGTCMPASWFSPRSWIISRGTPSSDACDAVRLVRVRALVPGKLSRNLTCRYRSREYQIQGQGRGYRLRGSTVTVCESFDGPISLLCQGKTLDYRVLAQGQPPIPTDDEKSLCRTVDKARSLQRKRPRYKPSPDHPWNRWARLHPAPSTPTP